MYISTIHDKNEIRKYLSKVNVENFVYQCGNLESPFWEKTQWYGLYDNNEIVALAMLGIHYGFPVLLASTYCEDQYQDRLLAEIYQYLPSELYSHLNMNSAQQLEKRFKVNSLCSFKNMRLDDMNPIMKIDSKNVQMLLGKDKDRIIEFLEFSHPEYILDSEFLEEGYFWGIIRDGKLVSLAGITAKSAEYGIVSIGNVTTHPDYRNQGLATQVISKLITELKEEFEIIVLNVKAENHSALNCYKKLGFKETGVFEEVIFGGESKDKLDG